MDTHTCGRNGTTWGISIRKEKFPSWAKYVAADTSFPFNRPFGRRCVRSRKTNVTLYLKVRWKLYVKLVKILQFSHLTFAHPCRAFVTKWEWESVLSWKKKQQCKSSMCALFSLLYRVWSISFLPYLTFPLLSCEQLFMREGATQLFCVVYITQTPIHPFENHVSTG